MATTRARKSFNENCADIDRLLEIHEDIGGTDPGRRCGLEVLNKSAIVLITAVWEAYCEDLAAEALEHVVAHTQDVARLPKGLRQLVATELKAAPHELAVWDLAGDGWREVLRARLSTLQAERNRDLNTPKSAQIDRLFEQALAIPSVSSSWYWPGMSSEQARKKLDRLVSLRGDIAHRGKSVKSVKKVTVNDHYAHVKRLVGKTGGRVGSAVHKATGKKLF